MPSARRAPGDAKQGRATRLALAAALLGVAAAAAAGLLLVRGGAGLGERGQEVALQASPAPGDRVHVEQAYAIPAPSGTTLRVYLTPAPGVDAVDLAALDLHVPWGVLGHGRGFDAVAERDADGSLARGVLTAGDLVSLDILVPEGNGAVHLRFSTTVDASGTSVVLEVPQAVRRIVPLEPRPLPSGV
ncbi:MAG TPA: hypothetical protein VFH47_03695 [Candidatus Thermoplasmatota archaeon]|nr:hypothetical protein [Candidatus Thermoplasmatota archaeon]